MRASLDALPRPLAVLPFCAASAGVAAALPASCAPSPPLCGEHIETYRCISSCRCCCMCAVCARSAAARDGSAGVAGVDAKSQLHAFAKSVVQ